MTSILPSSPSPARWSRYECKYLVKGALAERVRQWVRPFVEPDPHAAKSPDHSYRISSLYLDTPDMRLVRETYDGRQHRIKLRARCYEAGEDAPFFLEIKRRHDRIVEKSRAAVDRATLCSILAGRAPLARELGLKQAAARSYEDFVRLHESYGTQPIIHVAYQRQAYVGLYHADARVTFDREIVCAPAGEPSAIELPATWEPVEMNRAVLELKFTGNLPGWMRDTIRRFELQRVSYSKYGYAVSRSSAPMHGWSSYLTASGRGV